MGCGRARKDQRIDDMERKRQINNEYSGIDICVHKSHVSTYSASALKKPRNICKSHKYEDERFTIRRLILEKSSSRNSKFHWMREADLGCDMKVYFSIRYRPAFNDFVWNLRWSDHTKTSVNAKQWSRQIKSCTTENVSWILKSYYSQEFLQ